MTGFDPREKEVLRIIAFLQLDGSDGISRNIAAMNKTQQLEEYYKTFKQPVDGHTTEEKAMAFYRKKSEVQKIAGHWRPTAKAMERMKSLEKRLRRIMAEVKGDVNYSIKTLVDPGKPPAWLGVKINKKDHFNNKTSHITIMDEGGENRINQLKNIESLTPKQRKKNSQVIFSKKPKKGVKP